MTKILIVGGVAGGASAAARARRLSEDAQIIMFERGPFVSFANCGLPYHIGGDIQDRNNLLLQTPDSFLQRFNVDVRVQNEVIAIDRAAKQVTVKNVLDNSEYTEDYDFLILSPGAAPIVPPIDGLDNPLTYSLRNIPDMDKIINAIKVNRPSHATVVGGGFIGLEMMEALHQLDINVTLLEFAPQVMAPVDAEMAGAVQQTIRQHGVDLRLSTGLTKAEYSASEQAGCGELTLNLSDNTQLKTQLLIMAIGVKPETQLAQAAGLAIGPLGGIKVDAQMRTNDSAIFAVGDAVEDVDFVTGEQAFVPLAGPANRQGRLAADVIFGSDDTYQGTQGTAICKVFDLAVAATGKNERALQKAAINYEKVYVHSASHASYYPGAELVSLKLLFDPKDGTILGAQAFGKAGIDKRIDVIAVAQRAGMKVQDLQHLELTYAPPYGSAKDVVNQAAFVASNVIKGEVAPIHFNQIAALNDNQLLVDVRNPNELAKLGTIEGAINIPVDSLRNRMDELPKDKEIIVFCQVGLRGNVAYRQLANNGFKVKNLLGGYRTWLLAQQ